MRGVEDVAPYKKPNVFVPVVSTKCGARAARATLLVAIFYLNIRVRADIDVNSPPIYLSIYESFGSPETFFKRSLEKISTQTNTPTNTNL